MATAALTNTPTSIADGESITGWSGDTFVLDSTIFVENANSVSCAQTNNGNNDAIFTKATGSWDFSGGEHIRLWINSSAAPAYADIASNGGLQISLGDGTNTDYFYIGGSDTYGGGWQQFVIYSGNTPDVDNSANHSAITEVGFRMATTSKPRNVPANLWLDAWNYGDGFTVTGGTSGDEIDWSHIATVDAASAYGIVSEVDGVYFLSGEITIGDGISTTYFSPAGQIAVFKDLTVLSTLYKIIFFDDASALTNIDIQSGAWSAAGTQRFTLDASETTINSFTVNGLQMSKGAAGTAFHAGATVTSNVFNDCLQIDPSTSTFQLNTITGYTGTGSAILGPSSTTNFKDNIYIDNTDGTNDPSAIEFDTVGSYELSGDSFSGNDFDILNSDNASTITAGSFVVTRGYKILTVGSTDYTLIGSPDNVVGTKFVATGVGAGTGTATEVLVINKSDGANPTTASNTGTNADTLFVGSVPVTITVIDEVTGLAIATTPRVTIQKDSDKSDIDIAAVNGSGVYSYSHTGTTPLDIVGWVRENNVVGTDYVPKDFSGTITASGFSLTVALTPLP